MIEKPKTLQEKLKTLEKGQWSIEHREDGCSFISYPAFWNHEGKVWFGPFDPWVADYILRAVQQKQRRDAQRRDAHRN